MVNKWDDDKRYEKIACSLVGQCADENLTVEESRFVVELALQHINQCGDTAQVGHLPILPTVGTNNHTH